MLWTVLCDRLSIELPVIQAGMSIFTSAELVAAVSNAGALGSLGAWQRTTSDLDLQLALIRERTDRPFAVNHIVSDLDEDNFAHTLAARPPVISFALGDPRDLVKRAHDVGSLVTHQITTVQQACQAAERGVDVIIAQGSEAGGYSGAVAALALIPQVVDAVTPLPVVAAGGVADGRGLATVLMLGAVGVSLGTRFLASIEAPVSDAWKHMIVEAISESSVKVDMLNDIYPVPGSTGYGTVLRAIRTPFIDKWEQRRGEARENAEGLRSELRAAAVEGRFHELLPTAGQSAGLIRDISPAGDIVRRIVAEAEMVLEHGRTFMTQHG